MRIVLALVVIVLTRAHAAPTSKVAPMQLVDDGVCELLRSNLTDRCKAIAKSPLATVYQSGSKHGVHRFVLAIERGDRTLVGPAIDVVGDDAAVPTLYAITLNGRAGIALDLASNAPAGTTHAVQGCSTTVNGAWKCVALDLGKCAPTIGDDGSVESSCGGRSTLSID